jgi:hypothetical protein
VGGRALIAHEIQRELPLLFVRGEGKGEESTTADFLRMRSNTSAAQSV